MKQREMIKRMTDRELVWNVYITQLLVLAFAVMIGYFVFPSLQHFFLLWQFDAYELGVYGGGIACIVVLLNVVLTKVLPEDYMDDGGINDRIFRSISIAEIFGLTLLIAFAEEVLFRGVIQTQFGLVIASIIFALLHVRYLNKIVLFSLVVGCSFLLGIAYEKTGNLAVTFFAHFLIDFIMGVWLHLDKEDSRGGKDDEEG
ncbi:CPBP family intramembrane glutamic endopeptidase [Priestia taiwanensis]|uniref:CAAX amino protease n=1 Tax=Priestia taiwanensis TaxID=1347902 RepID=A0A917EMC2_9BACI|nr:CPBP family intramembrane glutamic endopeptidase [Priestia taiwanensis]MBM7361636.1 membrane protease YdiL (CAAX protease family) [Priestia taiwanensis]GGE55719.1 CAAX amino protease [Priestia taiwanensis]